MRRKLVLVAMATVLAAGSVACTSSAGSDADPAPTSTSASPTGASSTTTAETSTTTIGSTDPAERTAEPEDIVASLTPTDDDIQDGEQVELREQGDAVDGQVTLDYCSHDFRSESSRIARRQVNIGGPEGEPTGSVEAVLYDGGAGSAIDEVRAAIADCPQDELVDPVIEGQPPYVWDAVAIPESELGELAEDHVAVTVTVTPEEGGPLTQTGIWQVRGDALIATYAPDEARAIALAAAGNARLQAAAPADLGL